MYDLTPVWKELGFSNIETEIFVECSKNHSISILGIARIINYPRTTIAGYVNKMIKQGYLYTIKGPNGNRYTAASPAELQYLLETKKEQLNHSIKTIQHYQTELNLMRMQTRHDVEIKIYEGKDSLEQTYKKFQQFAKACTIFDLENTINYLGRDIKRQQKASTSQPGQQIKDMLIDGPAARSYQTTITNPHHHVKFLPREKYQNIQSDFMIIDGIIYHFAYTDHPIVMEIANPIFCQLQQQLFDELWEKY